MNSMDYALMAVGKAPGGAFTDEQMKKHRERKISKLTKLLPRLAGKKLARWMMDNSSSIIELIKYGDDK